VAVAGIMTTANTLLGDYFIGAERLKYAGMQGMFMSLAGVVFVGAGGILAEFDWRWPFLIYLSAWAALLPAVKYLREPVPTRAGPATLPRRRRRSSRWRLPMRSPFSAGGVLHDAGADSLPAARHRRGIHRPGGTGDMPWLAHQAAGAR